ncbi:MAG TPA: hypothetical protein PLW99_01030, partial [Candidatus Paceibacterota bacterium]|nr:hypothetical protein [Candidatus Paceibacterota bacterium]
MASITEGSVTNYYTSIQAAVNAASTTAIDTINVAPGTYTENVTISTPVILTGASGAKLVVPNVNESNGITVTANNVTIQGLDIEGPANSSYTTYAWGSINTRGIVIKNGVTGFTITNNKIENLRNDILIDGRNTGSVTNNIIDNSKSGISVQYTDGSGITITGNSQGTYGNDWGMNLHLNGYWDGTTIHSNPYPGGAAPTSAQTIINSDSSANGGWTVQDQSYVSANRTAVTVADTGTPTAQGDPLGPISTIQNGIAAVVPGGTVNVTAGSYAENVTVNNSVHLLGPNAMVNPNTTATRNTEATLTGTIVDYAGNTDIKGFTITDPSYGGGTIKGIHIYSAGPVISNINVENNIFSNITNSQAHGSYGVMVQGVVSNVNVSDNKLDGITSAGWAHAIEVTPTANASAVPQNVTVDGNSFSDVSSSNVTPDAYAFSNDWDSDTNNYADASQVTFHNNSLGGLMVRNLDAATSTLDATNNWWGSATSPASQVSAGVNYTPWYADAGMKALSSGGSTVTVSSGNFVPQTSSGTATLPTGTSDLKMGGGSTLDLSDATVATSSSATIDGNPAVALTKTVTLNSGTSGAITLS